MGQAQNYSNGLKAQYYLTFTIYNGQSPVLFTLGLRPNTIQLKQMGLRPNTIQSNGPRPRTIYMGLRPSTIENLLFTIYMGLKPNNYSNKWVKPKTIQMGQGPILLNIYYLQWPKPSTIYLGLKAQHYAI